ncbi:MAG: DUF202 domain-containing protein [Acidobacteriota bacterium]
MAQPEPGQGEQGHGEKDPRVYLAAERTFLAWIRTGLALMGFGFVVARFGIFLRELGVSGSQLPLRSSAFSVWTGTGLVLAGVIVNTISAVEYIQMIRELRTGVYAPGTPSKAGVTLALVLAAVGLGMAFYLAVVR